MNGLVERFNKTLVEGIQLAIKARINVKTHIAELVWSYLCTPHCTTKFSVFILLKGRKPRQELSLSWAKSSESSLPMSKIYKLAKQNCET